MTLASSHTPGNLTDAQRARVAELRRAFPALGDGWARFDGPGASQTHSSVLEAMTGYLRTRNANLGGAFPHSVETDGLVAEVRRHLGTFMGADAHEVGFGLNATALNSHLSRQATRRLRPGDEIVVTSLDHDANLQPWAQAAADHDLVLRTVGIGADSRLDMAALAEVIGDRTRVVAFPWANNAIGTCVDVRAVTELAHAAGAIAWLDATHYLPHGPVNVSEVGADVVVGSAYKFFGPHLGVFCARRELADRWGALEHGTLPFESIAGLSAAIEYVADAGWPLIESVERALGERFLAGLPEPWRLHGLPTMAGRTATFALTLPDRDPQALGAELAKHLIAAGAGDFHAPSVMQALGLHEGALRIGFLHYNTEAEVDRVLRVLADLAADRAR